MTMLSQASVKNFFQANIFYEIHTIREKIKLFETKYKTSFDEFEKQMLETKEENFNYWDDYMEWKAYVKSLENLETEKEILENGNFKIA